MPKTLSPTHKRIWLAVLLIGVVPPAGAQRPDAALPAMGKTLDLESAVRIALDQNPLNRAASEGIAVAKEAVGEARAPFYCNGSRSFPPRFSFCFPASWSSCWRAMWRRSVSAEQ
jgi:hypothetical protein